MKKYVLGVFFGWIVSSLQAQDIHFSQFGAAPIILNPALTGLSNCTYRATLNYRNQWASIAGPSSYQTYAASFDIGLFRESLNYSMLGLGLMVFNDVSADGALNNLTMMASMAYHQNLGGKGNHYLSLGGQAGLVQKSVDVDKLVFESMIGDNGVDPTLFSGEYFDPNTSYFDINVGANIRSRFGNHFAIQLGGAYHHLAEPAESFYNSVDNKINARYTAYASLKAGWDKFVIIPSGIYMLQTEESNKEITVGGTLGFRLEEGVSFLYLGGHYRLDDAIIPSLGIDYNNIQFGISYDVTNSELGAINNNRGGLELSLIFTGCLTHEDKFTIDCPRFM